MQHRVMVGIFITGSKSLAGGKLTGRFLRMFAGLALVAATGCSAFRPGEVEQAPFIGRKLVREDKEARLRMEVAVPNPNEAAQLFGRRLDHIGVQPVWLRVENKRDKPVFFLPGIMDHQYFAPLEVAYQFHAPLRVKQSAALDAFFLSSAMPVYIPPGATKSGFVFTHLDLGLKQVSLALSEGSGLRQDMRYTFHVPISGLRAEHKRDEWKAALNDREVIHCDDERLRRELEKLPRATTDHTGKKEGDPLNIVVIGTEEDLDAFVDCEWTLTERITSATVWRTIRSSLFGSPYRYSPMSHLYYAGRPQDISMQKVRSSVNLRNHLRLWVTPLRYHGKPVWIGQISRDIGVRWTLKTRNLTTHKVNPNVDETRGYLLQDLVLGQTCRWWGFVKGVEPATMDQPRHNLTGDPYFTDGLRAVIELSADPVKPGDTVVRKWEIPPGHQ